MKSIYEYAYVLKNKIVKRVKWLYTEYLTDEGVYTSLLPDKIYLKRLYEKNFGKKLDLKNPSTYNEKLNWMKLYNRKKEYTILADKYRVRDFVKERVGEEYLIPLYGVYNNVDEIDFEDLPNQFVLKCNHDSEVIICRDKSVNEFECKKRNYYDWNEAKGYLEKRLKTNYYKASREWPYKNIERKIVCEKYMQGRGGESLIDYKFYCFDGIPKIVNVISKNETGKRNFCFLNMDYKELGVSRCRKNNNLHNNKPKLPEKFELMKDIAAQLSKGIPHVRVDLYNIDGAIYFGEMTFFPAGGLTPFYPEEWDYTFGEYITLPKRCFKRH